jgi:hypothetical protein
MDKNTFSKEWWSKTLDLHESPPNNFESDDNHQYIDDNLSAINKIALVFNFPVEDLQLAFNGASNLVLSDDVWSKLENSNSYNIQTLGQALLYAKENKIDAVPYLKAIKNLESLPKALILNYDNDKYYLVNGEFVLSLQKALNLTPDTLMARINPKIHEDSESKEEVNLINEFINYVKNELGLIQTPKIDFSDDIDHVKEQCSFGYFSPDTNIIWVYTGDRNMADIFRTLAHELVHRKQEEDGKINYESGETGSDIENEANAKAGVLLRDFGKKHDGIYDTSIKKFIKTDLSEVKIEKPGINFTFPFEITKQNKSQAPFFADQLNKQGYTLKGKKIKAEDITFNIPTILDYDNNYRDKPERKILNTYSPAYEVKIQQPQNFPFLKLKKGQKVKFETKDFSFIGDIIDVKFVNYKAEFDDDGELLSADKEIKSDFQSSEAMQVYVKIDLKSFKIKPGAPSYIKVPKDEYESYMFINPEKNPGNEKNIQANNLNRWNKFTILNEVKIQNPVVDLDQKIKDISNDINDQIEHIYSIGDDTNDLNNQMDNITRTYNWDYTTESLKNMSVKNKIELYRDLENLQAQFK